MPNNTKPSILILYHFYKPDDVISARHFSDLAEGLAQRGWNVTVYTSNRYCRSTKQSIPANKETIDGVTVVRFKRPGFDQSKNISRMINSFTISLQWFAKIATGRRFDIVLLGTDPQLGYFISPCIRLFKPGCKIALWAFDLYPEIIAKVDQPTLLTRAVPYILTPWARLSYRCLDLIADLGCCMRDRVERYKPRAKLTTLIPWALKEPGQINPPDKTLRHKLFGNAKLAILYSGTIGKAHTFSEFIELARSLRKKNISAHICFAGRGNALNQLQAMITPEDTNISFAGFANEEELELRLSAADLHLISLREGWQGLVVPSKFFGSIATGRPLIFAGTPDSAIKKWIEQYQIGYYLCSSNTEAVTDNLLRLCEQPHLLAEVQNRTLNIWKEHFSKDMIINSFDLELRSILKRERDQ